MQSAQDWQQRMSPGAIDGAALLHEILQWGLQAWAKPIEANKNQSVDGAERLFLGSGSPQNVYLPPRRQNFSLERCPRPKQICDHPDNEPDKISHPASIARFSINC
jgi:hypothetical protein